MLEAMYANAPVIMADVNDLGQLVTEPNAGFSVESGNSAQLADAMTQLISLSDEELKIWKCRSQGIKILYVASHIKGCTRRIQKSFEESN